MFCPNCGSKNPDNARFCLSCGSPMPVEHEPVPEQSSRRVWLWALVCVLALTACVLGIFLLRSRSSSAPAPGAATPTPAVVSADTPSPSPAAAPESPSPTTQIVVITPAPPTPAPATPAPPTPSPAPEAPNAVKVYYHTKELDEFTEAVGNSLNLWATTDPEDEFSNYALTWSVSEPGVLKLEPDSYGRTCTLTVLKVHSGPVTLTVSCAGVKKDVKVYTKSATTPAPSAPSGGSPVKLEGDTLYRINIFLSNFSEQQIKTFTASTVADDYLLRFVELYCKINHNKLISYYGGEECLSLSDMNTYMNRFFGRTVNPYEGQSYLLDAWNEFHYSGGYFRFPAADGGSFNYFTVVDEMLANSDGTYTVHFQNYMLGLEEYWNTPGVDNSFYKLNHDQVANMVWNYRVTPVQGGTAVVRDYNFNGSKTYQILSYEVWDIEFSH